MNKHPTQSAVAGDEQTLEKVVTYLCLEFGLTRADHVSLSDVVDSLKKRVSSQVAGASAPTAPALAETPPRRGRGWVLRSLLERVTEPLLEAPAAFSILEVCVDLAVFLMSKNLAYGNSALDPIRVFSKADKAEQIRVRMDDKISRIMRGQASGEDAPKDLAGYWVLLEVLRRQTSPGEP